MTSLDNEIWNIEHLNYSRNIIRNDTEGQVLKHKIVKLETLGVYRYTLIIQEQGSSLSCNGTLLVYSKYLDTSWLVLERISFSLILGMNLGSPVHVELNRISYFVFREKDTSKLLGMHFRVSFFKTKCILKTLVSLIYHIIVSDLTQSIYDYIMRLMIICL